MKIVFLKTWLIKMSLKEIKQNLFTAPIDYALAHCVAKDFLMGAGIAVELKNVMVVYKFYYNKKVKTANLYVYKTPEHILL